MKRKKPFILATIFFMLISLLAAHMVGFAQTAADSAAVNTGLGAMIPANLKPFILAAFGVYEVIVRVFPTTGNYSITGWIIKLYQTILPNKNSTTPTQSHP